MTIRSLILGVISALVCVSVTPAEVTHVRGVLPKDFGGGPIEPPRDEITDAQRETIRQAIEESREQLRRANKLAPTVPQAHPSFGWPLRLAPGIDDPGYHGISNYVDLNPSFPDALLDFDCLDRTYDTSNGYNHGGTDFFTWPWSWRKMDRAEVQIVAAAPGQIVYRNNGFFDRSCGFNNNDWNAVYVQHADGSVAWYGHMKNNSLTGKQVGEMVAQGEFLGVVGSSGNSTGPHLHFEVHTSSFDLIEPWSGPCNNLNPDSWWAAQRPYFDSAVDRITTGDAAVSFGTCPAAEDPNAEATFSVGPTVYFTAYYRDQLDTQPSTYTVYRPDGSVFSQWSHTSPQSYAASYWFWTLAIPSGEPVGTWRFTVEFLSNTHEKLFSIGSPPACGSVPDRPGQGEPLKIEKISTSIRLTWGASCNSKDTDYAVYEGVVPNFTSHTSIRCSTSGTRAVVLTAPAGNRYYLVASRNATREGSLGLSSSGAERPPGVSSCATRFVLQCP